MIFLSISGKRSASSGESAPEISCESCKMQLVVLLEVLSPLGVSPTR